MERKTHHSITTTEQWDMTAPLSSMLASRSAAPTSAWRESEFNTWLEQKLASERASVAAKMQDMVTQHLDGHHKALLEEVEGRLGAAFTGSRPGVVEKFPLPSGTPANVNAPPCFDRFASDGTTMAVRTSEIKTSPPASKEKPWAEMDSEALTISPALQAKIRKSASSLKADGTKDHYKSKRLASLNKLKSEQEMYGSAKWKSSWAGFVGSHQFEMLCSLVIMLNTIVMATEVQYTGCQIGHTIGHPDCPRPADQVWPGATAAFTGITIAFTAIFCVELMLRLMLMRCKALRSAWIWFDVVLLAIGAADVVDRVMGSDHSVNPTMMRTARIARMLRMMKILKSREGFASLFLLIKSIQASTQALLWSLLLLVMTMTCVGMLMNQLIYNYLTDETAPLEDRREVFDHFGTYTRMLITMFELTVGNWAPPSRVLMVKITQWWGLFIVVYRGMFCFALVNVTAAVFITETNRVAANDDEVMMMRKNRALQANTAKLKDVFEELDDSGDGIVTWDEFQTLLGDEVMRQFLSTMDMDVGDLVELFKLLDDGDGKVECEEFVHGVMQLRGQAKNIDMLALKRLTKRLDKKVDRLRGELQAVQR